MKKYLTIPLFLVSQVCFGMQPCPEGTGPQQTFMLLSILGGIVYLFTVVVCSVHLFKMYKNLLARIVNVTFSILVFGAGLGVSGWGVIYFSLGCY